MCKNSYITYIIYCILKNKLFFWSYFRAIKVLGNHFWRPVSGLMERTWQHNTNIKPTSRKKKHTDVAKMTKCLIHCLYSKNCLEQFKHESNWNTVIQAIKPQRNKYFLCCFLMGVNVNFVKSTKKIQKASYKSYTQKHRHFKSMQ